MDDLYLWQNHIFDLSSRLDEWFYRLACATSVVNTVQLFWWTLKRWNFNKARLTAYIWEPCSFIYRSEEIFLKLIKICVALGFIPRRIICQELLFGLSKMWVSIILQRLSTAKALISIYEDIHFIFSKIHEVENVIIDPMKAKMSQLRKKVCMCLLWALSPTKRYRKKAFKMVISCLFLKSNFIFSSEVH